MNTFHVVEGRPKAVTVSGAKSSRRDRAMRHRTGSCQAALALAGVLALTALAGASGLSEARSMAEGGPAIQGPAFDHGKGSGVGMPIPGGRPACVGRAPGLRKSSAGPARRRWRSFVASLDAENGTILLPSAAVGALGYGAAAIPPVALGLGAALAFCSVVGFIGACRHRKDFDRPRAAREDAVFGCVCGALAGLLLAAPPVGAMAIMAAGAAFAAWGIVNVVGAAVRDRGL